MIFDGIDNFRDLGGGQLKTGLVFRSGCLSRATDSDLRHLQSLGITTILDLRMPSVCAQKPDRLAKGMHHVSLCHGLMEDLDVLSAQPRDIKSCCSQAPGERSRGNYRRLALRYTQVFARALKAIILIKEPVLFHCEMGKDRAGVLAALLFKLLDLSEEQLIADYLYSNIAMSDINKADLKRLSVKLNASEVESLKALFEVRTDYLNTFFNTLDDEYGSFTNYVHNGLQLTPTHIAQLKTRLLLPVEG